jgi:hypothetical protein
LLTIRTLRSTQGRQYQRHPLVQAWRIAQFGVAAAGKVLARDRPLGQALEHEIVDVALFGQFKRRF